MLGDIAIPHGGFRTIVADPPWRYGRWGIPSNRPNCAETTYELPYASMTVAEIKAMPVPDVAATNCEIYLWTTQRYLPEAFGVLSAWKARYCQILTWCKHPRGTGQGGMYFPTTEFLLLGRIGKAPTGKARVDSTWWLAQRPNRHSEKPETFQDTIETVSDAPRLELFARRERAGWTCWGNELPLTREGA